VPTLSELGASTGPEPATASRRFTYPRPPTVRYIRRPGLEPREALLLDVSAEALGLRTPNPPPVGAVLLVQLWGRSPGDTHTRLARVAGVTPDVGGTWLVDCRLTPPLSDAEVALAAAMGRGCA
jgi:hypothetical protein